MARRTKKLLLKREGAYQTGRVPHSPESRKFRKLKRLSEEKGLDLESLLRKRSAERARKLAKNLLKTTVVVVRDRIVYSALLHKASKKELQVELVGLLSLPATLDWRTRFLPRGSFLTFHTSEDLRGFCGPTLDLESWVAKRVLQAEKNAENEMRMPLKNPRIISWEETKKRFLELLDSRDPSIFSWRS